MCTARHDRGRVCLTFGMTWTWVLFLDLYPAIPSVVLVAGFGTRSCAAMVRLIIGDVFRACCPSSRFISILVTIFGHPTPLTFN